MQSRALTIRDWWSCLQKLQLITRCVTSVCALVQRLLNIKTNFLPSLCTATLNVVMGLTSILVCFFALLLLFIRFNSGWQATATNRSGVWSVNGKERNFFIILIYYLQATNDISQNICLSWGLKFNIWFNVSEIKCSYVSQFLKYVLYLFGYTTAYKYMLNSLCFSTCIT